MKLYSVLNQKIIPTKGIELKNEYIVKFKFETLYVQFKNDPVGRRIVVLSESDVPEVLNVHVNESKKKYTFFRSIFFSRSEKLTVEKENVIFFTTL